MDRRNFIRFCCGGFGLIGLFSLLKTRRALVHGAEPIRPAEIYTVWPELKGVPGSIIYDTVEVNPDGSTSNITYTFLKGPKFTNLEDAHKEIVRQLFYKQANHEIVRLHSVNWSGSAKKS